MKEKKSGGNTINSFSVNWHAFMPDDVFRRLKSSEEGLGSDEAGKRFDIYGINALPLKPPPSLLRIILHQVLNPLIFILLAACVASLFIREYTDAVFILIVIALNSALGAYQEFKAEKSAAALQNLLKVRSRVRRDGAEKEIPAEELVPGDVVFLESGMKVPADIRLVSCTNLTVDESFLTGESVAVEKKTGALRGDIVIGDRTNMGFAGSTVTTGRGVGVVVATGMDTEVGRIAENVTLSESAKPPLVIRMERFTKQITYLVVAASAILSVILVVQGTPGREVFFFVVALAVSAIPEGLPVALTVALSIATSRMSKRNVIVRKLTAVESLGSCTVIASDKTGTLTLNQQTARVIESPDGTIYKISGQGYNGEGKIVKEDDQPLDDREKEFVHRMIKFGVLANEANLQKGDAGGWVYHGDAIDVAFLAMAYKADLDPEELRKDFRIMGEIPYESERKFSAAFYRRQDGIHVALKGAVETVLDFCTERQTAEGKSDIDREDVEKKALELASKGYRVLALAGGEFRDFPQKEVYENGDVPELSLYGLVGFIDPLRPEAVDAVKKCNEAGIKVLMITGDHPETARAISGELGIAVEGEPVITGKALSDAPPEELDKLVRSTHVFARVAPMQKFEIVERLIEQGEFVAVTGDGVNDTPALRRANIGVAMGSGTDVAKETANMIVTDDNFSSIVSGVEEGRFAYDNVRKVIYLLISTGAAEVALFIASIIAGLPLPLLAVQLLWLNLVTNGIQDVALAFEGGEPGAMKRKPRNPSEKIFNPLMMQQTIVSGLAMGMIAFGLWFYLKNHIVMDEAHARNMVLLLMVLMQNVHVFSCRSERVSAFKVPLKRNMLLVFGVVLAQGIHILSMHIPFMQEVLRVEPITPKEWFELLILALPLLLVMEIFKRIKTTINSDQP